MQNRPTTPTTSCTQHRIQGYAFVAGLMVCRGCGLSASYHVDIDAAQASAATSEWVAS